MKLTPSGCHNIQPLLDTDALNTSGFTWGSWLRLLLLKNFFNVKDGFSISFQEVNAIGKVNAIVNAKKVAGDNTICR